MSYKLHKTKLIEEYTSTDKRKVAEAASEAVVYLDACNTDKWASKQDEYGMYLESIDTPNAIIRIQVTTDGKVVYQYSNGIQWMSIKALAYGEDLDDKWN